MRGALALAMMHVILEEQLQDDAFIEAHTLGIDALRAHVQSCTPAWAAEICGVDAGHIEVLTGDGVLRILEAQPEGAAESGPPAKWVTSVRGRLG